MAQAPAFEVASIKESPAPIGGRGGGGPGAMTIPEPNRVSASGVTLRQAIEFAYNVRSYQIIGLEGRVQQKYDIEAKSAGSASAAELRGMMQSLLAERFKLALHRENRVVPVYEMTLGKGGPKMPEVKGGDPEPKPHRGFSMVGTPAEFVKAVGVDMPVVDKTGLTAKYRFDVTIQSGQDLLTSIQDQFGLKFTPRKDPVEVLVIDHAEKLVEN
jgi:uncharacterized protein (TIGR03435 family)